MSLNLSPRHRWLLGALVVVALIAAVALLRPKAKSVAMLTVQRTDLTQSVVATGRINLATRVDVGSEVTATVLSVAVREGDRVRAGDLLVQLADAEALSTLSQNQATRAEAQSRLVQLQQVGAPVAQANLAQAQAALKAAETEFRRASELVAQGFFSQQRLDDARRALDIARASAEAAATQVQAQQTDGVETRLAHNRLQQADAATRAAQARLQRLQLRAPFDAVVLTRQAEPGGLAQPGKVLLSLGATRGLRIDVGVDERHLSLLQPGLTARAVADAYPSRPFEAVLDWVSPMVDTARGTVDVRLRVAEPVPDFLRADMTVSVDMQVGQRSQTLVLDASAVRDADGTAPWVLTAPNGIATKTPVQLGLKGVGQVEVVSGLAEGDAVIPATEKAAVGERVKPGNPKATPMSTGMGR